MSSIRRVTAQHLSQAWQTVPQVTQFDKAEIEQVENLRTRYAPRVEEAGGKLTMTAFLVKVLAAALEQFPRFNVSVDLPANTIICKKYIHVGVAVDTEFGLLVPIIRDANRKNIQEIAVELTQLSERARKRQMNIEEMEGGSISISNLGGIGGTGFSPIVNWPEVAILGVCRAATEPVWMSNQFVPKLMLPLSLSYDHRAVDGADAARFLRFVCEALEEPFLMALEG
jgi:pyruvate dehydrogenase E2 component (dihydrolipoamide acetyltransferase)